jgi:hypothetical protein
MRADVQRILDGLAKAPSVEWETPADLSRASVEAHQRNLAAEEALTHLDLLTHTEREHVLRELARSHPALVLAAVKGEESVWHGKVE